MLGVVGNIKIRYSINETQYEQIVDPQTTEEFCLEHCENVRFRVEEVTYIEDTVYGVVLSLLEPEYREDEYLVGSITSCFKIEKYKITGFISMSY